MLKLYSEQKRHLAKQVCVCVCLCVCMQTLPCSCHAGVPKLQKCRIQLMHPDYKASIQWLTCMCCLLQTLHSLLPVVQDIMQHQPIQVRLKGLEYMNDHPSAMHVAYLGVQDPVDQAGSVQKLQQLCTAMVDAHADAGLLLSRDERCCSLIYVLRYHMPTPAQMHGIVSIHAMCMSWPIMTNSLLMALRRLGMLIVYGYWLSVTTKQLQ